MSIQQISPNSVAANPAYVNPKVKIDENASTPQVSQDAQKSVQTVKTDTVTISQQALQKLAGDGDSGTSEAKANVTGNPYEKALGTY